MRQCSIIKKVTASQKNRLPDLIRCMGVSHSLSYNVFPPTQLCAPDYTRITCTTQHEIDVANRKLLSLLECLKKVVYVVVATTSISFNLKHPASSCSDNLKNTISYVLICYQKSSQSQEMLRLHYISTNVIFFCVI